MAAALNLAERGIPCTIVEKSPTIGGMALDLGGKGARECVGCDVCLSTDRVSDIVQSELVRVFTKTEVTRLSGGPGAFRVSLRTNPGHVREDACVACGACHDACPVEGGAIGPIRPDGAPKTYSVDASRCLALNGVECTRCRDACPTDAIDFNLRQVTRKLVFGAIIVAAGFEPFDASRDKRLGYGVCPDVITAVEAERCIRSSGRLEVPSTGKVPGSVAVIQCVGSRNDILGASYCSKVCCKYALKLSRLVKTQQPSTSISFFFMDWRPQDFVRNELEDWRSEQSGVSIVRSRPAEIMSSDTGRPVVRFSDPAGDCVRDEEFDLVVLSVGMRPPNDAAGLASLLHIDLTDQGFLMDRSGAAESPQGVFVAGSCSGPMDIEESAMDGAAAAAKVSAFLGGLR